MSASVMNTVIQQAKDSAPVVNPMAAPKLLKIVVNMGVKNALSEKKNIERAGLVLAHIGGQKAKVTKARKSISTFKLREGDEIGLMVTLRGKRMHDFFQKLVHVVLPRLRDFHGVSTSGFDGKGNYSIGFSEVTVFPEIDPGKVDAFLLGQGLHVVIVTTARDDEQGRALLLAMGMPFRKAGRLQ